ncbi:MAG: hypothetical protein QM532_00170 [Cyanobium sp. MAG06]|nr:hypothetical protein [Cyanobium sp. MAG06]
MINNRNYLKITVQDERTTLEYLEEGDILFSHIYNIGHKSIEDDN